jgi:putative transposase
MEASDIKRLKNLEEENARIKCIFSEHSIDHSILKDVISKKAGLCKQRELMESIVKDFNIFVIRPVS